MVRVTLPTHARLMRAAAAMQNKSGAYTSMDAAINTALDAWEKTENLPEKEAAYNLLGNIEAFAKTLGEAGYLHGKAIVIVPLYAERRFDIFAPSYIVDSCPDRWELVGSFALPDQNNHVIIKQSDGALYLEKMLAHNHNAYLTPHKNEAMIFDSPDQAKSFLRQCGHEVGNWIIEPVNRTV